MAKRLFIELDMSCLKIIADLQETCLLIYGIAARRRFGIDTNRSWWALYRLIKAGAVVCCPICQKYHITGRTHQCRAPLCHPWSYKPDLIERRLKA